MNDLLRMILIAVLGLLLLGAGLCSGFGLVLIVSDLRSSTSSYWIVAGMFTAVGLLICWLSWLGIRRLRREAPP